MCAQAIPTDGPQCGIKVGNRYILGKYLGGGAYGRIHFGENTQTGERIIVKLERKDCQLPQLFLEWSFYKTLGEVIFLPKVHALLPVVCNQIDWTTLMMEALGPSLAEMHKRRNYSFEPCCTVNVALQVIDIMEYVHDHGIVHRDIKPDNFLLGASNGPKWNIVHVIDFGTSKRIILEPDCRHEDLNTNKAIATTARYMSIGCHKKLEMSRRDDMEAVVYMIAFLMKGQLPWQGVTHQDLQARYEIMGKIKEKTTSKELFKNYPREYEIVMDDVRSLDFPERPRYSLYREHLRKLKDLLECVSYRIFDWTKDHQPIHDEK